MCLDAHGDMMPDDWRYELISAVLDAIKDYGYGNGDAEPNDLDAWRHEIVDGLVDIYTHDLTAWLHSNVTRYAYCDDAAEEMGDPDDTINRLQCGQFMEIEEIFSALVDFLRERYENQNEDEDGGVTVLDVRP